MSNFEEETYSTIFNSLKHPVRRKILRMLSDNPKVFSEMLEMLGISSSHLTYHLENLGQLVSKRQDGKYELSTFGEAAAATMRRVEETPRMIEPKQLLSLSKTWKSVFAVLMIGLVVLASISYVQYHSLNRIFAEYEGLRELVDLVEDGASLRHEYTLRYKIENLEPDNGYPIHMFGILPACLIYNLNDNSTLSLSLSISILPSDSQVSVNLQEGNAFDLKTNETAPVIWSANTTMNSIYSFPLVSKGWYTISLFGPIQKNIDATGKATGYNFFFPFHPYGVDCWVDIRMVYEGKYSPFLVKSGRI